MFTTEFVERGHGLLLVGFGRLTGKEVLDAKKALAAEEDRFRQIAFALVVFRDVTELDVTIGQVRELAEIDKQLARLAPDVAVAVVAPGDEAFGLARMWQALTETTGWQTEVFRTQKEAASWLGRKTALPDLE
jgi:hypothetical protein